MKHPSNRELFEYWNQQRGGRRTPERGDLDPAAIRHLLADTFILACAPVTGYPFRVAGTRVCALFGRDLKGVAFLELWQTASRDAIRELVTISSCEAIGWVASVSAATRIGAGHDLEMLMLPLGTAGRAVRLLGALSLGGGPRGREANVLDALTLGTLRYVDAETPSLLAQRATDDVPRGYIRHGLVVYEGGLR